MYRSADTPSPPVGGISLALYVRALDVASFVLGPGLPGHDTVCRTRTTETPRQAPRPDETIISYVHVIPTPSQSPCTYSAEAGRMSTSCGRGKDQPASRHPPGRRRRQAHLAAVGAPDCRCHCTAPSSQKPTCCSSLPRRPRTALWSPDYVITQRNRPAHV